jgi:thioredoxin 1
MKEIYYFTAPWCKSCANLQPHIEKVAGLGVTIHKIDVEENPRTAEEYDVMQIPTIVMIQDDAVIGRKSGFSEGMVLELYKFAQN